MTPAVRSLSTPSQPHKLTPPNTKIIANHGYDRSVNELLYSTTPAFVWSE